MQWFAVFRFLGLAGDDPSYLEDYASGLARAATQHYVEAAQGGTRYGFWLPGGTPVGQPGAYTTDQLWMVSLYDMNLLSRLQRDTGDAAIGQPPIPPSQVLAAWARTLERFGATVSGDGTAAGRWPNQLDFTWSGARIGGTLAGVAATPGGGDPDLYETGKATLTALLVRAGRQANDPALTRMGSDLTELALAAARGGDFGPLGKIQGEYLARLHAAVAGLSGPPAVATFVDVPPAHAFWAWIEAIVRAGLTGGCGIAPLRYCPDQVVTRAQMAALLLRGLHGAGYAPPAASGIFADVSLDHPLAGWMERLFAEGITSGCATDPLRYCPEQGVTRSEMAVFLLRATHGAAYAPPEASGLFADVTPGHVFARFIERLAQEGITAGCGASPPRYCPDRPVTRGEMAVFLARAFALSL